MTADLIRFSFESRLPVEKPDYTSISGRTYLHLTFINGITTHGQL